MDENAKSAPLSSGRWLALIVAAVVLAEGIWAMLVSVTRSLILPLLARITGGDSQSALYLGKGNVNVPDLFASVLQICLAAMVFLIIKSWRPRGTRVKAPRQVKISKPVPSLSIAPQPAPLKPVPQTAHAAVASAVPAGGRRASTPGPAAEMPAQPQAPAAAPPEAAQPAVQPKSVASPEPAKPSLQPQPAAKPAKPKKPQEVYYNIVGEPMSPEDE
jgi:hypothetical protein